MAKQTPPSEGQRPKLRERAVPATQRPMTARCTPCGWEAHAGTFDVAPGARVLLACPRCRSVRVDTSAIAAADPGFLFGSRNCFDLGAARPNADA